MPIRAFEGYRPVVVRHFGAFVGLFLGCSIQRGILFGGWFFFPEVGIKMSDAAFRFFRSALEEHVFEHPCFSDWTAKRFRHLATAFCRNVGSGPIENNRSSEARISRTE